MEHILYSLYREAISKASSLETWPGHFLAKKIETEVVMKHFNFEKVKNLIGLEVGCGNAFQSTLLASIFNKFVATDLFERNTRFHSVGIYKAKILIDSLNVKNIHLVSCSAISLPFADNYFDFVFSSSALEHIEDKNSVLHEMKRVLKPNGYLILILPTHIPSIYAFPHVFLFILARVWKLMLNRDNKSDKDIQNHSKDYLKISLVTRFKKSHPSFPLPEPHGIYSNIFEELYQQFPRRWVRLINKSGLKVIKSFPACLVPWLLIEPFSTQRAAYFYSSSKRFHLKFGNSRLFRCLAYLIGFIAVKNQKIRPNLDS